MITSITNLVTSKAVMPCDIVLFVIDAVVFENLYAVICYAQLTLTKLCAKCKYVCK